MQAIQAHRSFQSEATAVIERFNFLQDSQNLSVSRYEENHEGTKARKRKPKVCFSSCLRVFVVTSYLDSLLSHIEYEILR